MSHSASATAASIGRAGQPNTWKKQVLKKAEWGCPWMADGD
jgi:hypothetical protein